MDILERRMTQRMVGRFINEMLEPDPRGLVPTAELHNSYVAWAGAAGVRNPLPRKAFIRMLWMYGLTVDGVYYNGKIVRALVGHKLKAGELENVDVWLSSRSAWILERLADIWNVSKAAVLEKLLVDAMAALDAKNDEFLKKLGILQEG